MSMPLRQAVESYKMGTYFPMFLIVSIYISQNYWSLNPFTLLKLIEDHKELLVMWVIDTDIYHM